MKKHHESTLPKWAQAAMRQQRKDNERLMDRLKRLQARIKKLEADIRHLAKRLAKYELAEIKSPTPTEGKSSCETNG